MHIIHVHTHASTFVIMHKMSVIMSLCTIFVPQVVPEAAGVPILKQEFPVLDVPQRKREHTSCI